MLRRRLTSNAFPPQDVKHCPSVRRSWQCHKSQACLQAFVSWTLCFAYCFLSLIQALFIWGLVSGKNNALPVPPVSPVCSTPKDPSHGATCDQSRVKYLTVAIRSSQSQRSKGHIVHTSVKPSVQRHQTSSSSVSTWCVQQTMMPFTNPVVANYSVNRLVQSACCSVPTSVYEEARFPPGENVRMSMLTWVTPAPRKQEKVFLLEPLEAGTSSSPAHVLRGTSKWVRSIQKRFRYENIDESPSYAWKVHSWRTTLCRHTACEWGPVCPATIVCDEHIKHWQWICFADT